MGSAAASGRTCHESGGEDMSMAEEDRRSGGPWPPPPRRPSTKRAATSKNAARRSAAKRNAARRQAAKSAAARQRATKRAASERKPQQRAEEMHIDLVALEAGADAEPGAGAGADNAVEAGDVLVATRTLVEVEQRQAVAAPHAPQVFASNRRFRPLVLLVAVVGAIAALYGAVSLVAVARSTVRPTGELIRSTMPDQVLATAPGVATETRPCSGLDGRVYVDADGNGVATANEFGVVDLPLAVRDEAGTVIDVVRSDEDGAFRLDLPGPMVATLEVVALPEGLWPGPRPANALGSEAIVSGPSCTASLGFVWMPDGGQPPRSSVQGAQVEPLPLTTPVRSALIDVVGGGVQIHGRLWAETVDDRRFSLGDEPVRDAVVTLLDAEGALVSEVQVGPGGEYTFMGLDPHKIYEVVVAAAGRELVAARAMGSLPLTTTEPRTTLRTGSIGLPLWGVDFMFAG